MAGKQSIIGLHAEVTARASQFIDEYAKADRASKQHNASIREELSKTGHHIQREFGAQKIAKGLMSGVGLGGGMEIARRGIEAVVEHFKEAAEHAKKMGEYVEAMRDDLREMASARFENFIGKLGDGPDKVSAIERRITEVTRQRDAAVSEREEARTAIKAGGWNAFTPWAREKFGNTTIRSMTDKAQVEVDKQQKTIDALNNQLDALDTKRDKTIESASKARADAMSKWLKPFNDQIEAENKRAIAAAEKLRDAIATPTESLAAKLREVADLAERGRLGLPGGLNDAQSQRAMDRAFREYNADTDPGKNPFYQRWEKAAGGLKIDDYTKRGLGTGANYQEIGRQTNSILVEIRELIKRWLGNNPKGATYGA